MRGLRYESAVLGVFVRDVFASRRRRTQKHWGVTRGQCGAVTFVQRLGGAQKALDLPSRLADTRAGGRARVWRYEARWVDVSRASTRCSAMGDAADILIRFSVFFGAAALALVFHRRRAARIAFLTVFVALLCSAGFSGRIHWPFFGWHLYAHAAKQHLTFYEVRVADARGRAIRLDARAAPPTMATPLNRIARRMRDLPGDDGLRVADFLLRKAADYRAEVERRGRVGHPGWKFPAHQMGYRWTADGLADYGPFVELQVVRIDGLFTPDGRGLPDRREQLIVRYQRAASESESGGDRA